MSTEIERNFFEKYPHVVPLNDLKNHNLTTNLIPKTDSPAYVYCECDCKPEHIEVEGGGVVIVHHSYDGREGVEIVNRLLEGEDRCLGCGCKISKGEDYCSECLCEDDSDY